MTDITELKRRLSDRAQEIAEYLLPRGVRKGREWCAGSIEGESGESLKVAVQGPKAGTWADFAASESGDLIDLWCAVRGVDLPTALDQIRAHLGTDRPQFEKREKAYRRPSRPQCAVPKSAVLEYLTGPRKLTPAAITAYRVGEQGRTIVFPSALPTGELAAVKYLGVDRGADGRKQTRVEKDCEPVLFGWQAVDQNTREVTITEGEIDALTAWDYGRAALSVPFGGGKGEKQAWIENEFERLHRFETIYLALDMDAPGNEASAEIAARLGRHRCRRVALPRKDLNECRQAGIERSEIDACFAKAASLDPKELVRAGAYTDAVTKLFWPSGDAETGYRLPWAALRERVIFRPGELTLWTGATGAGKSQALGHAIVDMGDQGARVCIASLEMAPPQLLRRMVKQAGNTDRPTEGFIHDLMTWIDGWTWLFGLTGKASVAQLLEVFEYARARYGCDVFVVDSLMRLGVGSEDWDGQERAIYELVSWAVGKDVHVHLVAHSRKADRNTGQSIPDAEDVKGASEIASNAFNIIGVSRIRTVEDALARIEAGHPTEKDEELAKRPPVIVNVAKQRNGDWEGKAGLWFNRETYRYRSAGDDRLARPYIELNQRGAA